MFLLANKAIIHSHALGVLGNPTYHVFKKHEKTYISKKNLYGRLICHSHAAGAALVLYFVQQITPPICPAARPAPRRDYGFSLSTDSRERLNPESRRDSGMAAGLLCHHQSSSIFFYHHPSSSEIHDHPSPSITIHHPSIIHHHPSSSAIINHHPSSIIHHHPSSSIIIIHHPSSSIIIHHHLSSSIISHHPSSSIIMYHQ